MTAIPGTRRQYKEMADGTLRVAIDIDPPYKQQFLSTFGEIDMPVALAPLVADFESAPKDDGFLATFKGGPLCKLAAILCGNHDFREWLSIQTMENIDSTDKAAEHMRLICGIASRRELDHDPEAARIFHERIRQPWVEYERAP